MDQEINHFNLPDIRDKDDSDDQEDYNPFIYHHQQEGYHSFEKMFQNHFDIVNNRWITIPRTKIYLLRSAMHKLKKWLLYLRQEHHMIQSIVKQNDDLKTQLKKNQEQNSNHYLVEQQRTNQLYEEIRKVRQELKDKVIQMNDQIQQLKDTIAEKDKKIQRQELTIQRLNEVSNGYENQNKGLQQQINNLQKDFTYFNNIKRQGFIDEKALIGGNMTTFELVLASKVKSKILQFLSLKDYQNLMICNRKLYLSLISHNTIIPHAVNSLSYKFNHQYKLLQSVNEEFKSVIKQSDDPKLREIMIKQFELKVNFSEYIIPTLRECQSLIDGDNFIGLKNNQHNKDLMDLLEGYLTQQAQSYQAALQSLVQEKFPWNQFFPKPQATIQQVQLQRKQFPTSSQMFAQQIITRLYDLSTVCAQDSSIFGMFLSQLQRCLASLFVYGQHLTQEVNDLQSLNYYIMTKFFFLLKEKKQIEDQYEDFKTQLGLYSDAKRFLNEKVKDLEKIILDKNEKISSLNQQIYMKESQLKQNQIMVQKNNESIRLYQDKLKILAREVMEVRRKYKNTCVEYNEIVSRENGKALKKLSIKIILKKVSIIQNKMSSSSSSRSQSPKKNKKRVYVTGYSLKEDQHDIKKLFKKFGKIEEFAWKGKYCFIEFKDSEDAEKAVKKMNKEEVKGSVLQVEMARGNKPSKNNGLCYSCGRSGHFAKNCRHRSSSSSSSSSSSESRRKHKKKHKKKRSSSSSDSSSSSSSSRKIKNKKKSTKRKSKSSSRGSSKDSQHSESSAGSIIDEKKEEKNPIEEEIQGKEGDGKQ
ncbi:unnamed protein product [Paramecium primaurelia]|uniref:CCHC-type domain-containing protein n=1 Tax=Paramecium primaurelia TaxID=5886 RepID=A0A8S1LL25_PARPR|nr:unnamed protein product [Paramecium primaurelia]